jgi:hypothetical protein
VNVLNDLTFSVDVCIIATKFGGTVLHKTQEVNTNYVLFRGAQVPTTEFCKVPPNNLSIIFEAFCTLNVEMCMKQAESAR